jgi:hypothetical protein
VKDSVIDRTKLIMWKNWRQPAASSQTNIMSYDDYYDDERYLETIHEVESIKSRRESVAHPPVLQDLPLYVSVHRCPERPD